MTVKVTLKHHFLCPHRIICSPVIISYASLQGKKVLRKMTSDHHAISLTRPREENLCIAHLDGSKPIKAWWKMKNTNPKYLFVCSRWVNEEKRKNCNWLQICLNIWACFLAVISLCTHDLGMITWNVVHQMKKFTKDIDYSWKWYIGSLIVLPKKNKVIMLKSRWPQLACKKPEVTKRTYSLPHLILPT